MKESEKQHERLLSEEGGVRSGRRTVLTGVTERNARRTDHIPLLLRDQCYHRGLRFNLLGPMPSPSWLLFEYSNMIEE